MNGSNCSNVEVNPRFYIKHDPLNHALYTFVLPPTWIFGTLGNIATLFVLRSEKMRNKTTLCLSFMAGADICFFQMAIFCGLIHYLEPTGRFIWFFVHTYVYANYTANVCSFTALWLTVAITAERYIAVRYPLHARLYLSRSKMIKTIGIVLVTGLGTNLYRLLYPRVVATPLCPEVAFTFRPYQYVLDRAKPGSVISEYYRVSTFAAPFTVVIVPFIVLLILSLMLIHALWTSKKNQNTLLRTESGLRSDESKITVTVLAVVVAFLTFYFPSVIVTHLVSIYSWSRLPKPLWLMKQFLPISNGLLSIGRAINFAIYCGTSSVFRQQLASWIWTSVLRQPSGRRSSSSAGGATVTFATSVFNPYSSSRRASSASTKTNRQRLIRDAKRDKQGRCSDPTILSAREHVKDRKNPLKRIRWSLE